MDYQERNNKLFIADMVRQVFGINSPIYIPWGKNIPYQADEYPNIRLLPEEDTEEVLTSEFGTHVFGSIQFDRGEFNTYNRKTGAVEKVSMEAFTLPHSCIVEFSRDANITKTNVLGNLGTVKELYGKGDWDITIRGIALNSRDGVGAVGRDQINQLVKWDDICDSIPVVGSIFREKGINNITIESLSIQPIIGRLNAIPFQINAVSDEALELYLL